MLKIEHLISLLFISLLSANANTALADSIHKVEQIKPPYTFQNQVVSDTEKMELKKVTQVSNAFAKSHLLGTGASQYLTMIKDVTEDSATAILGESGADGDDPEAYKINLKKIFGKWKVVTYQFGKVGSTGDLKRGIERVDIQGSLYPSALLDQQIEDNGGVGYYKQFPNELDKNEVPIMLMRRSRYVTVDIINNHKTNDVVIGKIQRGKRAETIVSVYGRSENDVSKYIQDVSSELPLIAVINTNQIEACGKSIVKTVLSITADQTQLSIPNDQNTTKLLFDMDGKRFDCNIQETR